MPKLKDAEKVNYTDYIKAVAKTSGLTQEQAKTVNKAELEVIAGYAAEGKHVDAGFATFNVGFSEARPGVNPQTKEPITIPAKSTLRAKVSNKLLKAAFGVDESKVQ